MNEYIAELYRLLRDCPPVRGNPKVTALLVDENGKIISRGVHRGKGHPHAEIEALNGVKNFEKDLTLFVSLEPCNHTGSTGPCTEAIIEKGIRKVVVASLDPNPVSQGGLARLKQNNIEVFVWGDQSKFIEINRRWFEHIRLQRPYVTLKAAMSLDGFIAREQGKNYQITSQRALEKAHQIRAEHDAILVGTGTVQADNPFLTVRNTHFTKQQAPLRVIMGKSNLKKDLNIFNDEANTVQIRTHDPRVILEELKMKGVTSILLEGGGKINRTFLQHGFVDELQIFISSKILGSKVPLLDNFLTNLVGDKPEIYSVIALDPDLLIQAKLSGR